MTVTLKNLDNYKNFDWDLSKIFYFVAKFGSYTEASKVLGVLQPTLTRQVQTLEKQLGFPLLTRHMTKGVKPTRKGEELLSILETVFIHMKAFSKNIDYKDGEQKGRKIILSTTHAMASYAIGDILFDYTDHHPHLNFEVIAKDQSFDIIVNDHDIAIRPYDKEAKGVHQELLFTCTKKLYASHDYLAKYGEPKSRDDLKNHTLMGWHPLTGEGEYCQSSLVSNSLELEMSAARKGKGIIGTYKELSLLRDANLINVLPHVQEEVGYYFMCPDYLKEDPEIMDIKTYLQGRMALFCKGLKQVA